MKTASRAGTQRGLPRFAWAGLLIGAVLLASAAPAAAAGVQLPDNRGYEMVSPPDKNGYAVLSMPFTQSSASGDAVDFAALGPFADAQSASLVEGYAAFREGSGWVTHGITPPIDTGGLPLNIDGRVEAISPDFTKDVVEVKDPDLAPGAPDGVPNLYLHDLVTGTYQLVSTSAPPNPAPFSYEPIFAGASADFSRIFFVAEGNLIEGSGANEGVSNLYEWHEGQLSLVSTDPAAVEGSTLGNGPQQFLPHGPTDGSVSTDGSRVVFTANSSTFSNAAQGQLWLKEGESLVHVSASQAGGGSEEPEHTEYQAATPDASKILFLSPSHLTDDASPAGEGSDLYEYDVESGELSDLTGASPDPEGLAGVVSVGAAPSDLSYVYFAACGQLVEGVGRTCEENGLTNSANVYVSHNGELAFVANINLAAPGEGGIWNRFNFGPTLRAQTGLSADGRTFAFESDRKLTAYENEGFVEVYVYRAESGETECASCNPSGAPPLGNTQLADETAPSAFGFTGTIGTTYQPRSISADGSKLFFTSPDRLLPQDGNNARDVYEWENGELHLISSGEAGEDSMLGEVSASGDDVFFYTPQSLVPSDTDGLYDLYDARVNGGFPVQPEPAPCEGNGCHGPATSPPAEAPAASSAATEGNSRQTHHRRRHRRHRRHARHHRRAHR